MAPKNSVDTLFAKAQGLADQFEYDLSAKFLIKIISTLEACHIPSLELLGMLSNELEDFATAFDCYARLVTQYEEKRKQNEMILFEKEKVAQWYLCLAQLCDGQEALNYYSNASVLFEEELALCTEKRNLKLRNQYCGALFSMAEIYFTDFGGDVGSDEAALALLEKARQLFIVPGVSSIRTADALSREAHILALENGPLNEADYLTAQIRLNQGDRTQALLYLDLVLDRLDIILGSGVEDSAAAAAIIKETQGPLEANDEAIYFPSMPFRLQVAKLAMELERWQDAIDLLQDLNHEVAENIPDVAYLWGWSLILSCKEESGNHKENDSKYNAEQAEDLLEAKEQLVRARKVFFCCLQCPSRLILFF